MEKFKKTIVATSAVLMMLTGIAGCKRTEINTGKTEETKLPTETTSEVVRKQNGNKNSSPGTNTGAQSSTKNTVTGERHSSNAGAAFSDVVSHQEERPQGINENISWTSNTEEQRKDTTPPQIIAYDLVVAYGKDPDFSSVEAFDAKDGKIAVVIAGVYDTKKPGVYPLSAVAVDSDSNSARVDFYLTVEENPNQSQIDELSAEIRKLSEKLTVARNKYESDLLNLEALKAEYEDYQKMKESDLEKVASLKKAKEDAKLRYLEAAEEYDAAVANLAQMESELNDSSIASKIEDTRKVKTSNDERLLRLKEESDKLSMEKEKTQAELLQASANVEAARDAYGNLIGNAEELASISDGILAKINKQQEAVNSARKEYDLALSQYRKAFEDTTSSDDFVAARNNLDQAILDQEKAVGDTLTAKNELDSANKALDAVKSEMKQTMKSLNAAKSAAEEARKKADSLNEKVEAARKALSEENGRTEAAQKTVDALQKELDAATIAREETEKRYSDAKERCSNADENLAKAKQAVSVAKAKVDEAQSKIDQGSMGFFRFHDSNTRAEDTLFEALANQAGDRDPSGEEIFDSQKTILGDKDDATSLDNMLYSIQLMREGNELRNKEGVSELMVTDYMMAVAQIKTNGASGIVDHTHWYGTGENLVFDYVDEDPYYYWYEIEKSVYDYVKAHPSASDEEVAAALDLPMGFIQTGHYRNLIKPAYEITGFAVNSDADNSIYPYTYGQEFSYLYGDSGKAYTVDQYEADFRQYYDAVMADFDNAKKALDEARAQLSILEANGGLTEEEQKAVEEAKADLNVKTAALESIVSELAEEQAVLRSSCEKKKQAEEVLESAEKEQQSAAQTAEALSSESQTLAMTLLEKSEEMDEAAKTVEEAKERLEEASVNEAEQNARVEEAQNVIDGLNEELSNAKNSLEEAKANVSSTEASLEKLLASQKETSEKLAKASDIAAEAKEQIGRAESELNAVEEKLQTLNEAEQILNEQTEEAEKESERLSEVASQQENSAKELSESIEAAKANIEEASSKMETAKQQIEEIEEIVSQKQNNIEAISEGIKVKESEIEDAENEADNAGTEIGNLEADIRKLEEDIKTLEQ